MPIYEYRCEDCAHEFEVIQKMTESALKDCPQCGQARLKKLISASGFQLKGTGWYATDFKDSGKKADPKDSGKKADPKSSAKPQPSKPEKTGSGGCGSGGCGCAGQQAIQCGGSKFLRRLSQIVSP